MAALRKWTASPIGYRGGTLGAATVGEVEWEVGYALLQRLINAGGMPIAENADAAGVPNALVPSPPPGWSWTDCTGATSPAIPPDAPYSVPLYPERRRIRVDDPVATDNATSWLAQAAAAFTEAP